MGRARNCDGGGNELSELETVAGAHGSARDAAVAERLSRRHDAEPLLRRMLALGDILAVTSAAVLVGLWGSGPASSLLLVLFAPIWIVTAKLAGLYDRDHRTLEKQHRLVAAGTA